MFMLAKDGEILGGNANHTLKFLPSNECIDEYTSKPVYNKVAYEYETPAGEFFRITYNRRGDISKQNFIDRLFGPMRFLAKIIGFEGSYLRFEGNATIEKIEGGSHRKRHGRIRNLGADVFRQGRRGQGVTRKTGGFTYDIFGTCQGALFRSFF